MKDYKKVISDKPVAIALFAIGAAMCYFSFFFRESRYSIFGSTTELMPRISAILIMVFSVVLFIQSAKTDRKAAGKISGIVEQLKEDKAVYFMFIVTALYIYLFTRLGFVTSTFLYTVGATFMIGKGRIKLYYMFIIALTVSMGAYLFFAVLLGVIVPRGILL